MLPLHNVDSMLTLAELQDSSSTDRANNSVWLLQHPHTVTSTLNSAAVLRLNECKHGVCLAHSNNKTSHAYRTSFLPAGTADWPATANKGGDSRAGLRHTLHCVPWPMEPV